MSCDHTWISNGGDGGHPKFRILFGSYVMRVLCAICECGDWLSPKEWRDRDQGDPAKFNHRSAFGNEKRTQRINEPPARSVK